jgi:anaphase-promoting complex subunit 4
MEWLWEFEGGANELAEEPRSVLVRIAYQSARMPYQGYTTGQCPSTLELDGSWSGGISSCFAFSAMTGFAPIQMEVQRASKLRGEIPARVCLLGRDRAVYKIYALPEGMEQGKEE